MYKESGWFYTKVRLQMRSYSDGMRVIIKVFDTPNKIDQKSSQQNIILNLN